MGKYEPLGEFLRSQPLSEVRLKFDEIERITKTKLPPKAQLHRAWWSNNPSNNVMTKVWLEAGFRTEQVDMTGRKLVFRRARSLKGEPARRNSSVTSEKALVSSKRHPLFGALKGFIRLVPGTDLTKPADPEWGDV